MCPEQIVENGIQQSNPTAKHIFQEGFIPSQVEFPVFDFKSYFMHNFNFMETERELYLYRKGLLEIEWYH